MHTVYDFTLEAKLNSGNVAVWYLPMLIVIAHLNAYYRRNLLGA